MSAPTTGKKFRLIFFGAVVLKLNRCKMDRFSRQNHRSNANDSGTMEERKAFFRQFGLQRHEVFEYALRSFETPQFDLDYFEYRYHKMKRQNLAEAEIRNQLLNEICGVLQTPSNNRQQQPQQQQQQHHHQQQQQQIGRNAQRSNSPIAPPPPIIGRLLPVRDSSNNDYNRARSPSRNMGSNQRQSQNPNGSHKMREANQPISSWNQSSQFKRNQSQTNFGSNMVPPLNTDFRNNSRPMPNDLSNNFNIRNESGSLGNVRNNSGQMSFAARNNDTGRSDHFNNRNNSGQISADFRNTDMVNRNDNWNEHRRDDNMGQIDHFNNRSNAVPMSGNSMNANDNFNNFNNNRNNAGPMPSDFQINNMGRPENFNNRNNSGPMFGNFEMRSFPNSNMMMGVNDNFNDRNNAVSMRNDNWMGPSNNFNNMNNSVPISDFQMSQNEFVGRQGNFNNMNNPNFGVPYNMNANCNETQFMFDGGMGPPPNSRENGSRPIRRRGPSPPRRVDIARDRSLRREPVRDQSLRRGNQRPDVARSNSAPSRGQNSRYRSNAMPPPPPTKPQQPRGVVPNQVKPLISQSSTRVPQHIPIYNSKGPFVSQRSHAVRTCLHESLSKKSSQATKRESVADTKTETPATKRAKPDPNAEMNKEKSKVILDYFPYLDEFMKPTFYGEVGRPKPKGFMTRGEYNKWWHQNKWISDQLMKVDDNDPEIRSVFFSPRNKEINHGRIRACEETIDKCVQILDDWHLHKDAFDFLKHKAIVNEFLYVDVKEYLGDAGRRCLNRIFTALRRANMIAFYKAIIQKWSIIKKKDRKLGYKPEMDNQLRNKSFNWLVNLAFQEIKLFTEPVRHSKNNKLKFKLKDLHAFVKQKNKDIQRSGNPFEIVNQNDKNAYINDIIEKIDGLLKKSPEINYKNCSLFMGYILRLANKNIIKHLNKETVEKRIAYLAKLKADPYTQNVQSYMAKKMLSLYERLKYLEAVHPRMISREDFYQMLVFQNFFAESHITLFAEHVLNEWLEIYGDFNHEAIAKNMRRIITKQNDNEGSDDEDEGIDDEDEEADDGEEIDNNAGTEKDEAAVKNAVGQVAEEDNEPVEIVDEAADENEEYAEDDAEEIVDYEEENNDGENDDHEMDEEVGEQNEENNKANDNDDVVEIIDDDEPEPKFVPNVAIKKVEINKPTPNKPVSQPQRLTRPRGPSAAQKK